MPPLFQSVHALAQCCDTLRTNSWPDGIPVQDPEAVAENELLGAATAIESAAEKLKQMRPRHVQHVGFSWTKIFLLVKNVFAQRFGESDSLLES
jgi:hypothetical protein